MIVNTHPQEVQQSMRETHPTCMSAVPRFWEKVYMGVMDKIEHSSAMQRRLFKHALSVGRRHNIEYLSKGKKPPITLHLEYEMLNRTVFSLVRKELGLENAHFFPTAGAAVSALWKNSSIPSELIWLLDMDLLSRWQLCRATTWAIHILWVL